MCKCFLTSAYSCILQCLTGQSKSCGQPTFTGWRNTPHFFLGRKRWSPVLQSIIEHLQYLIEGEVPMVKNKWEVLEVWLKLEIILVWWHNLHDFTIFYSIVQLLRDKLRVRSLGISMRSSWRRRQWVWGDGISWMDLYVTEVGVVLDKGRTIQ